MKLFEEKATLIKDGEFKISHFKKMYKEMEWVRVPRSLGPRHKDFFYVGSFEDDNKKVVIKIRPTMFMVVQEIIKNCDKNGDAPPKNYRGTTYEFGHTVEVKIDETFLNKIKEVASSELIEKRQKVVW